MKKTSLYFGLIAVSAFAMTLQLFAAPYGRNGLTASYTQPTGVKLTLKIYGDEFYAVTETVDGFTLYYDGGKRAYYYAALNNDGTELVSSGRIVSKAGPPAGLKKHLRIAKASALAKRRSKYRAFDATVKQTERWNAIKSASKKFRDELRTKRAAGSKSFAFPVGTVLDEYNPGPQAASASEGKAGNIAMSPPSYTLTGDVVGLTILVDFSDVPGTAVTPAQVDDYCNKPGFSGWSNSGSIYDYFYAQSAGKLRYSNNVTYYVRVPQPKTYYNQTSLDSGYCGRLLLNDALDVLLADGYDFSSLTTKSGGNVRACNVYFAGANSGVWAKGLWPHRWVLSSPKSVGGGKYIYDYQITNIGSGNLAIGTFCHENGHMLLGYPDFYDYDYDSSGMSKYTLMASYGKGTCPVNIHGYLKYHSGWVSMTDLRGTTTPRRYALRIESGLGYWYTNPSDAAEYFILENFSKNGWMTNATVKDEGLMITHNDENGDRDAQQGTEANHYETAVEQADGSFDLEGNSGADDTDHFHSGGIGPNTVFNDSAIPDARWWSGATGSGDGSGTASGLDIHDIGVAGEIITFVYGSGAPSGTPMIGLTDTVFEPRCDQGANAASDSFAVYNQKGGTLTYTISDNVSWLSVSSSGGGTATTEADKATITYNTSGLSAGSHTATITISAPAASPTSATITVNLTVNPRPTILLNPTTLSHTLLADTTGQGIFTVENSGGGTLDYSISESKTWMSLSHTSGTAVKETDSVYVNFDASSLSAGTYHANITVTSSNATNSGQTVAVTLIVKDFQVTSPNGGENIYRGSTQTVTWTSSSNVTGQVKIELYKSGSLSSTIVDSTPNCGFYSWSVPGAQAAGADYKVVVTAVNNASQTDDSDANFTIATLPSVPAIPYIESFETDLGYYTQSTDDDMDWTRRTGNTPSNNTGPASGAHDGSYYVYTEATGNFNSTVLLDLVIDLRGTTNPMASFYYHMYDAIGGAMGTLKCRVSVDSKNWTDLFSISGNQGTSWQFAQADLSAYAGNIVVIQFHAVTGPGYASDICLDLVTIAEANKYLTYGASAFIEANTDDGSIANSVTITAANETFTATVVSGGLVTASNVPAGLTADFVRNSNTQITMSLTGNATNHTDIYDINDLTVTFVDGAFAGGDANGVSRSTNELEVVYNSSSMPKISINDVTVTEGDSGSKTAQFTVSLSKPSRFTVTVDYATGGGTATAGADYTAIGTTTLTFAANQTSKTVNVAVLGDVIDEDDETFNVTLSNPFAATILDDTGVGTINDNDSTTISINDVAVDEGDTGSTTNASFSVTLSLESSSTVTVGYVTAGGSATEGVDFSAASGTVTFLPGETSHTVDISVIGDDLDENNEQFTVGLYNPVNATIADNTGVGTINDDDDGQFVITPVSGGSTTEGGGTVTFNVRLASAPTDTVTVDLVSDDPSEGTVPTTDLVFTTGNWSNNQLVTVSGKDDALTDGDISYHIDLTGSSADLNYNNATASFGLTNLDDEVASFTILTSTSTLTVNEGGTASVDVRLSANPGSTVVVTITPVGDGDISTADGPLTFTNTTWGTPQTVTFSAAEDIDQTNGQSVVTFSNAAGTDAVVTVTESDNDASSGGGGGGGGGGCIVGPAGGSLMPLLLILSFAWAGRRRRR